ncbi:hypothetical protein OIY81_931 [Cryptosporidium canis]|nr:hypothetical protein OIY81_931 [Cryptosporidium canis]
MTMFLTFCRQALSQDAQGQFYSKFNSIVRDVRNKDPKWFRGLFCIGCNEVLRNLDGNIVGVIFSQKLFSLGIGSHILTACKLKDVPCIILMCNTEMSKWVPGPNPSISCVGLRRKIDSERLNCLGLKETEYAYESIRSALSQLIIGYQSTFEVPYLDINNINIPQVQIRPLNLKTLVVNPKIDYPKCMRRSEKRKLRKERRKGSNK